MNSSEKLELSAAISHASRNHGQLEHPWYGVWALVLRKLCRIQMGDEDGWYIVPVIYPQDPVAYVHVDLQRVARNRQSIAPSPPSPNTRRTGSQFQSRPFNVGPSTPPSSNLLTTDTLGSPLTLHIRRKKGKRRRVVYSDSEDIEDNSRDESDTASQNPKSKAPMTPKFMPPPPEANRDLDSTRYPDFSRILSFYASHFPSPLEIRDLIVEIKIRILLGDNRPPRWMHRTTREQTKGQAWHAFQSDKKLKIIGCIIAYGEFWTYEEYGREDIPRPATTAGDDDEYVPSDEEQVSFDDEESFGNAANIPPSVISEEIGQIFEETLLLKAGTNESDYMLSLIERRLREVNSYFWDQVTPNQ